jgi:hypothetical protein
MVTLISIAITPSSMVIIIAIMLEASMKKNTKLLHLIASKINYKRRTSITCRHAGRYTIIGQPQPSCCNGDTQVTEIITHRSSHDIEAIPFTSYPAKQVKHRTYSTVGVWKALKALRENIDRIYRIAMKISSDWSNQTDLGHSQCPSFSLVNHIDYRDRYIREDRTTRVRYVDSISSPLHS